MHIATQDIGTEFQRLQNLLLPYLDEEEPLKKSPQAEHGNQINDSWLAKNESPIANPLIIQNEKALLRSRRHWGKLRENSYYSSNSEVLEVGRGHPRSRLSTTPLKKGT